VLPAIGIASWIVTCTGVALVMTPALVMPVTLLAGKFSATVTHGWLVVLPVTSWRWSTYCTTPRFSAVKVKLTKLELAATSVRAVGASGGSETGERLDAGTNTVFGLLGVTHSMLAAAVASDA
jgi:hypothetical protein